MELPREPGPGRRRGPPALLGVVVAVSTDGESMLVWTLIGAGRPRPMDPYPLVGEFEREGVLLTGGRGGPETALDVETRWSSRNRDGVGATTGTR